MAGVAGALYVPQVGIINPSEFSPANSIEAVIWVAVGGRGTLTGAVLGAVVVNYAKTTFTSGVLAPYWLFMLGGLFVAVTLLLPRGIVGTWQWLDGSGARAGGAAGTARRRRRAAAGGVSHGRPHHLAPALPQRRDRLVRRFPRPQQSVARGRARRDARHHRPERRRQDHDDGRRHRQDAAGQWRRLFRRRARSLQARRNEIANSASAASSRSRRCSRCTPSRTTCCWRCKATAGRAPRCGGARPPTRLPHQRNPRDHSPDGRARPRSPAAWRTARSNGWRSACCWRRSRSCCWSTSRSPA